MTNALRLSTLDDVHFDVRELVRLVESTLNLAIDSERACRLSTAQHHLNRAIQLEHELVRKQRILANHAGGMRNDLTHSPRAVPVPL